MSAIFYFELTYFVVSQKEMEVGAKVAGGNDIS